MDWFLVWQEFFIIAYGPIMTIALVGLLGAALSIAVITSIFALRKE